MPLDCWNQYVSYWCKDMTLKGFNFLHNIFSPDCKNGANDYISAMVCLYHIENSHRMLVIHSLHTSNRFLFDFQLLEEICNLGRDPKYICQKPSIQKADGTASAPPPRSNHAAEEASSEDEEEEEVQAMQSFNSTQQNETEPNQQ